MHVPVDVCMSVASEDCRWCSHPAGFSEAGARPRARGAQRRASNRSELSNPGGLTRGKATRPEFRNLVKLFSG